MVKIDAHCEGQTPKVLDPTVPIMQVNNLIS